MEGIPQKKGEHKIAGTQKISGKTERLSKELKLREERYRIALSQIKIGVWEYDIPGKRLIQTESTKMRHGMSDIIEDVPNSLVKSGYIHPDSAAEYYDMYDRMRQGASTASCIVKVRSPSGSYWRERMTYTVLFDEKGKPIRAIGASEDITAQTEAEERYAQEIRYREAATPDVIASFRVNISQNRVEDSRVAPGQTDLQNCTYQELIESIKANMVNDEDKLRCTEMMAHGRLVHTYEEAIDFVTLEYLYANQKGKIRWVCCTLNILREPLSGDLYGFIYIRDVDKKKKLELSLIARAERDAVTGLYGRETTQSMANMVLAHKGKNNSVAMLLVDIDNFRTATDTYGEAMAEKILIETGRMMKATFATSNIIGRVGKDEFVVLLENLPSKNATAAKAGDLCKSISTMAITVDASVRITVSIGIAFCENDKDRFEDLYKRADFALYMAKQQGKNKYIVYSKDLAKNRNADMENVCIAKEFFHKQCVIDEIDEIIVVVDVHTHEILYMNGAGAEAFHTTAEEYSGKICYQLINGQKKPCEFCGSIDGNAKQQPRVQYNEITGRKYLIKDKPMRWNGKEVMLELLSDITDCKSNDINHDANATNSILLECISALIAAETSEIGVNKVLETLGKFYGAARVVVAERSDTEAPPRFVFEWHGEDIKPFEGNFTPLRDKINMGQSYVLDNVENLRNTDEELYNLLKHNGVRSLYSVPLYNQDKMQGCLCAENITKNKGNIALIESVSYFLMGEITRRRMQEKQEFLSYHDAMTNVRNRNSYIDFMGKQNEETLSSLGILSSDINGLSLINKKFGHNYGDEMIKEVAATFSDVFGKDNVFRFSGDEFVVVCQDITHTAFVKLIAAAQSRLDVVYPNAVPIGYAWASKNIHIEEMRNNADELLLNAKQEYYKNQTIQSKHGRSIAREALVLAMNEKRFVMYLQPKADILSGEIHGAEALVRYKHPEHGIIMPGKFIPLLEQSNLISYIDFFILEETCKTLQRWKKADAKAFPISVNFSRATLLQPNMVSHIIEIADKYNVPHELIEIEITESLGAMEKETIAEISRRIRAEHFRIALDDFGSKFTSMSILAVMEFDVLKLDKSLADELVLNGRNRAIVQRVIQICSDLGIQSIAEGVETKEQLAILKDMGCAQVQGYLYNKPIPIEAFQQAYLKINKMKL